MAENALSLSSYQYLRRAITDLLSDADEEATSAQANVCRDYQKDDIVLCIVAIQSMALLMQTLACVAIMPINLKYRIQSPTQNPPSMLLVPLCGFGSGLASSVALAPAEFIKCRLQVQSNAGAVQVYKGPVDLIKKVWRCC